MSAPRNSRSFSLQRRLLWRLGLAVAGLWLLAAALVALDARHELDELLDAHLAQSAALLVAKQGAEIEGRSEDERGDDNADDEVLDAPVLHRYAPKVAFQVWHEGVLVLRSPNAPITPMGKLTQGFETRQIDGEEWRLFAAAGRESDVQVWVGEDMAARHDILGAILRGLLLPLLIGLPLIGLAGWWLIHRELFPLRQLHDQLAQRGPHELTPLPEASAPVPIEISPLRERLDTLFERIASLLASERRFTADAAHELRTPIAAIRTQAQVALGAQDEAERRHALHATLSGCDRATHLVRQLLTLSRLEARTGADTKVAAGPVDLVALARRTAADLAPQALERGQTLALEAPDAPCPVAGDDVLLGVLLRNLVDNALRYSPPGAEVEICIAAGPSAQAVLRVEDSGPGLGDTELARLGERFFRVLGSGAEGSGLGWSIVRRIADVHHAHLSASRSARFGGLCVEVRLACAAMPPDQAPGAAGSGGQP